jgi:tRNA G18 (ribose-2'-O)-methylase SpoU
VRGYFGIGVDGISKPMNVGSLLRTAHAFGASFFFTLNSPIDFAGMRASDTSGAFGHVPFYAFDKASDLVLPDKTALVAVELIEGAVELPSFRHPLRAVYVLGREMGSVSDEVLARCDHVIKIPMKFCVNVGVAGAIVMYDRLLSMGRFADRPVRAGGPDFAPKRAHKGQLVNRLDTPFETEN